MTFKAYRASAFSHGHENLAFNLLHDTLQAHWAEQDEPLHLLGNFYVDGCEIDALIIKRNALIVIDFKDYGGTLSFSENGRWLIDGVEVRGGSKTNPYQQIRDNKFRLLDYLKTYLDFQSSPNWGHIAGLCLFHQDIELYSPKLAENISRWFHITDLSSAVRMTDAIASTKINFSNKDIDYLISIFDVPAYFPDGRPQEVPIPSFETPDSDYPLPLNSEQSKANVALKDWLADRKSRVFSLSGAFYTGKNKLLSQISSDLHKVGYRPIFLAPNQRVAARYISRGFPDTVSIYQWLYSGRANKIKNGKRVYPIDREDIDPDKDIVIIFDAHLLGEDYFETDTSVYGSGFILQDLLDSLRGLDINDAKEPQQSIELLETPRLLLVGDPYQLTRGSKDKSLLSCQIFEQQSIACIKVELKSQDRNTAAPIERLDFQGTLIGQLMEQKFTQLPLCQQNVITTISRGQHTDVIAEQLLRWPHTSVYLCPTNQVAQSVNLGVRKKYLATSSPGILVKGDIIDLHNRTYDHSKTECEEFDWVASGQFARVMACDAQTTSKSIKLKGVDTPVTVEFATATIEYLSGTADIWYLPDFLSAEKPQLTQHQSIALDIWAREDADNRLVDEKAKLDLIPKEDAAFKVAEKDFKDKKALLVLNSIYSNVARLRYAYALTVHRAQNNEPLPRVILDGRAAHDTENPATDSYFRWLYTATLCTSDQLQILDYPQLTPLSKANWHFDSPRLIPIILKQSLDYDQTRTPTDAELSQPLPAGFKNPEPKLLALLLTIYELIDNSGWKISNITQHSYLERYVFNKGDTEVIADLNYNGKYTVSLGKVSVSSEHQHFANELKGILSTPPKLKDKNIIMAVDLFKDHLSRKNWTVIATDENNYKVYLIAQHTLGKIKLGLDVPSDSSVSKRGVISHITLAEADSKAVADQFEEDFSNG